MSFTKVVVQQGHGARPRPSDLVVTIYRCYIKDASKLDNKGDLVYSSNGKEFVVQLGNGLLIQGWEESLLQMNVGEKAILDISSDYAYGSNGFPPRVPPDVDLIFEIELLGIGNGESQDGSGSGSGTSCSAVD
ncbi:hypothetical protein CDD83_9205 [Cordyceps sp. RAO-2017]|nr:hypothetical protein CDD83_9205 [Cordyceps sp. RAO-2017]